jgi:prepilin-type N-terminal cleavage/methylation domain-containing protein
MKRKLSPLRRARRLAQRGFTLIELLIATGITLVIAGMMVGVTTQVLSAWNRASDTLEVNQTARTVLDMIATDLQAAAFRNDGNVWMWAGFNNNLPNEDIREENFVLSVENLPAGDITDFGSAGFRPRNVLFGRGMYFAFFASTLDREDGEVGGLNALGYQVNRRAVTAVNNPRPDSLRYILFRKRIRDRDVFNAGYQLALNSEEPELPNPNYPLVSPQVDPAVGPLIRPSLRHMLGLNIIDFGVIFYDRNGAVLFPTPSRTVFFAPFNGQAPASADIIIRVLTSEGADVVNLIEQGIVSLPSGTNFQNIVLENSNVFTRRVAILSQPL